MNLLNELNALIDQIEQSVKSDGFNDFDELRNASDRILKITPKDEFTIDNCVNVICEYYSTTPEEVRGDDRHRHIVYARKLICYFLKLNTLLSWQRIGFVINCDHATAMYSVRTVQEMLEYVEEIKVAVSDIQRKLRCKKITLITFQVKDKPKPIVRSNPEIVNRSLYIPQKIQCDSKFACYAMV